MRQCFCLLTTLKSLCYIHHNSYFLINTVQSKTAVYEKIAAFIIFRNICLINCQKLSKKTLNNIFCLSAHRKSKVFAYLIGLLIFVKIFGRSKYWLDKQFHPRCIFNLALIIYKILQR